jgi:zona occludens toxin (predicted ATPase)
MPITNLFGPPGAGKSYEMVNFFMLNGVEEERPHIYYNVEGIDPKKWEAEFGYPAELMTLIDEEWFADPGNFPVTHADHASGKFKLKGGELIIVDEAGLLFPAGTGKNSSLPPQFERYLRKHRHFTGLTGKGKRVATDIVLASQDPDTLAKPLMTLSSGRVDFAALKEFHPRAYRATYYKSRRATRSNMFGKPRIRMMNAAGYARYNSFAGGADAQVIATDKRIGYWTFKRLATFGLAPLALLVGVPLGGYFLYSMIHQYQAKLGPQAAAKSMAMTATVPGETPCEAGRIINVSQRTYFEGGQWKPAYPVVGPPARWKLGGCYHYFRES